MGKRVFGIQMPCFPFLSDDLSDEISHLSDKISVLSDETSVLSDEDISDHRKVYILPHLSNFSVSVVIVRRGKQRKKTKRK